MAINKGSAPVLPRKLAVVAADAGIDIEDVHFFVFTKGLNRKKDYVVALLGFDEESARDYMLSEGGCWSCHHTGTSSYINHITSPVDEIHYGSEAARNHVRAYERSHC